MSGETTMHKRNGARILVVDDEQKTLDIVEDILRHEGYRVSLAATAADALRIASQEDPDLILLDLFMPGVSGTELLRQLVALDSMRPVIVISAHADIPRAVEATLHGASNFLEKPLKLPELLRHVEEQLRRGRVLRQTAADARQCYERYGMVGISPQMRQVYSLIERVAPSEATVLIVGETGTGKELAAAAIHRLSRRSHGRFVPVNCSAFPETLLESQLFGHKKGAFTGASRDYEGLFVFANGGTLFLDEISCMSPGAQAKVLRTLETGDVQPVGSESVRKVDVRILAATNRDLKEEVKAGRLREDLFYRLNVVSIHLPPLRERREDIPLLVEHFRHLFNRAYKKQVEGLHPQVWEIFRTYAWPGNIRELKHVLEHAFVQCKDSTITPDDLPADIRETSGAAAEVPDKKGLSLQEVREALARTAGNKAKAARLLGISRPTLYRLLERPTAEDFVP